MNIKNSVVFKSFKNLNKSARNKAVTSLVILALFFGWISLSFFGPRESSEEVKEVQEAAQQAAETAKTGNAQLNAVRVNDIQNEGNNANDPALQQALTDGDVQRKEEARGKTGTFISDSALKQWDYQKQGDLNKKADTVQPVIEKTTAEKIIEGDEQSTEKTVEEPPKERKEEFLTLSDEELQNYSSSRQSMMATAYLSYRALNKDQQVEDNFVKGTWNTATAGEDDSDGVNSDGVSVSKASAKSSRATSTSSQATMAGITVPGFAPGDTLYGVLEGAVNTDTSEYTFVRVVSGPLKGGRIPVTVKRKDEYAVFESVNLTWDRNVASNFKAIVMSPEAVSTNAFSTSTDRHIFYRYGMLFLSSIMEGAGEIAQAASTDVEVNGDTVISSTSAETKDYVIAGLGKVGQRLGNVAEKNFERPPTVYVADGTPVAVVVIEPAEIAWLPKPYLLKR